ncbi:hypothetical protein D3C87_1865130 [compost metagenome]
MQQIQELHQELLGFTPLHHVFVHIRIHAGVGAQCLHIMGIGQKPDIKNQIRINRHPVFEAEGNHVQRQLAILDIGKPGGNPLLQLDRLQA